MWQPDSQMDWQLSPSTGWTRAHWVAVADHLLAGVAPYRSRTGAHIDLPGYPARAGLRSDGLEGFARTFLLAAFRAAGDGDPHGVLDDYLTGLRAGTTRRKPVEPWQPISHVGVGGQPMVEAASIALGLRLTREWTWDRLDAAEQDDLESWLRGAFHHEPAANNWYLFPMTVAGFLSSVGRGDEQTRAAIDRATELLESWHHGGGWYSDGDGRAFDHYLGWAMHFYPLLVLGGLPTTAMSADQAELRQRYRSRIREFVAGWALSFDDNGAPLYQGRSLTYRFAAVAPVAAAALAGADPLPAGRARQIASGSLRYFLERGALTDGVLTRGWHGPHAATLQNYSGPASPYWASKAFVALLMPAEHPFWSAPEPAQPQPSRVLALPAAGWLLQRTDGLVRLHNHGSDHVSDGAADGGPPDPLYGRFAYSTRTGPTALRNPSDNDLQIELYGVPSARRRIEPRGTGPDWAASAHVPRFPVPVPTGGGGGGRSPMLPGARIESLTVVRGGWEIRTHRFHGVPAGLPVRLSGWALAASAPSDLGEELLGDGGGVRSLDLASDLLPLLGWDEFAVVRAPEGTAYGSWSLVPEVRTTSDPQRGWYVVAVRLQPIGVDPEPAPRAAVRGTGPTVGLTVSWADGHHLIDWTEKSPTVIWQPEE